RCPRALAEKAYALQQRSIGDTRSGEDQLITWSQVFRAIHSVFVANPHARDTLFEFRFVDHQSANHVSIEAADRGRGNDPFRRAPRSHNGVNTGANYSRRDAGG